MILPRKWLADFTDVSDIGTKEYCDVMTDTGSKVESFETLASDISGVVVGKVLTIDKHPDADKLVVTTVDIGKEEPVQIVTGAKNVFEGALVPVATDGADLPGDVHIKKGKLRGVESWGMMCSIAELGLTLHDMPGAIENGILILNDVGLGDAVPGTGVKELIGLSDDVVEFEITPNRPDCLSVIGLARETAASFGRELNIKDPEVKPANNGDDVSNYIRVDIESDLCFRYSAAVVKNVKIEPSPMWLRMRLRAAGVRPINNIVDITNYVMLEYGQPMHAFDYSCLDGSHIIVRNAKDNENYMSLDDKEHVLDSSMLVIADEKKAVALAGIMGGANSEIKDSTATVVFESACFKGSNVRVTGRKLGMRTESSGRFEKGMDPENTMPALKRACELVQLLAAGEVVDGVIDVYPNKSEATKIPLEVDRINHFLGVNLTAEYMEKALRSLCFEVEEGVVTVPSYRADVLCMNDLAEEVIRIYGYNKIESTGFVAPMTQGGRNAKQQFSVDVTDALCGMGLDEINTFSFISPSYYDKVRLDADDKRRTSITIKNPLGEDTSVMRTMALPSIMQVLSYNYNQKNLNAHIFELATVYIPNEGENVLPTEKVKIAIAFTNPELKTPAFFEMKGYVEALIAMAGIKGVKYVPVTCENAYHPGRCAQIMLGDKCLGIFGELHPQTLDNYDISAPCAAAELDFEEIFAARKTAVEYQTLPKFPAVERDFSFVCPEELAVGDISEIMENADKHVASVKLFDIYRGPQVGENKKSVSYAVMLRAADHTMTDEEADGAVKKIMKKLGEAFGITLRS